MRIFFPLLLPSDQDCWTLWARKMCILCKSLLGGVCVWGGQKYIWASSSEERGGQFCTSYIILLCDTHTPHMAAALLHTLWRGTGNLKRDSPTFLPPFSSSTMQTRNSLRETRKQSIGGEKNHRQQLYFRKSAKMIHAFYVYVQVRSTIVVDCNVSSRGESVSNAERDRCNRFAHKFFNE